MAACETERQDGPTARRRLTLGPGFPGLPERPADPWGPKHTTTTHKLDRVPQSSIRLIPDFRGPFCKSLMAKLASSLKIVIINSLVEFFIILLRSVTLCQHRQGPTRKLLATLVSAHLSLIRSWIRVCQIFHYSLNWSMGICDRNSVK